MDFVKQKEEKRTRKGGNCDALQLEAARRRVEGRTEPLPRLNPLGYNPLPLHHW